MDANSSPSTSPSTLSTSFADFIRTHRVRLGASLVLCLDLIAAAVWRDSFFTLLWLTPVLIGCLFPLLGVVQLSGMVNGWEQRFDRLRSRAQGSNGKFSRYFLRPLSTGSLWLWKQTTPIWNPDLRAGLRLTAAIYLWGGMAIALATVIYVMIIVVLAILFILLMLWIASLVLSGSGSSSGGGHKWKERLSGTRIIDEGVLFDTSTGMKVNEDGRLMKENFLFDQPTGIKINDEGQIVREGFLYDDPTGIRLNEDGQVMKEGFFDAPTGMKIDDQGQVVEEGIVFDKPTGKKFTKG